jgi:beta-lactam-binding protein with PASTA domain
VVVLRSVPRSGRPNELPLTIQRLAVLLLKNGLLVLGLLAALGASALLTMRAVLTSQDVVVPSLLTRRIPEAGLLAAHRGLSLRVEGKRNDARVPADHILAQEPTAGSALKAHRSIRVWLSLGPRRLTVPAVEGESLRTARLTLEQAQLPIGRVIEVDDPVKEGTILVQHPPPGETDALEEGMALLVSHGPAGGDYLMPDLIGRKAEDVLDGMRVAGLKVAEVRYRTYPGVAPGIVLRQTPAAGHRVSPRSSVSLDISKAAP